MTLEQAAQLFVEAANEAILHNERLAKVLRALHAEGIHVEGVLIEATMTRQHKAEQSDADFLRQLRIVPDIEVRE
jgi:hypothetical protein